MYLDYSSKSRDGWRYVYKGSEMLPAVYQTFRRMCQEEQRLRLKLIEIMSDPRTSLDSEKTKDAQREVNRVAPLVEELMVYTTELKRRPDEEYRLSAGDVVFFGLLDPEIVAEMQSLVALPQPQ